MEWNTESMCEDRVFDGHIKPYAIVYDERWYTAMAECRCAPAGVIFMFIPSLLCNSGNKSQNNTLVGAWAARHSKLYIILYVLKVKEDCCVCMSNPLERSEANRFKEYFEDTVHDVCWLAKDP